MDHAVCSAADPLVSRVWFGIVAAMASKKKGGAAPLEEAPKVDKLAKVQQQTEDVTNIMRQNIGTASACV